MKHINKGTTTQRKVYDKLTGKLAYIEYMTLEENAVLVMKNKLSVLKSMLDKKKRK